MFKNKEIKIKNKMELGVSIKLFDSYKKNLNEWIVVDKSYIFNLETNEKECFLEITPVNKDLYFKFFIYESSVKTYKVTEDLYNKIQKLDIIKLILEKEEKEND